MNLALVVHHYDRSEGTGGYVARLLPRLVRHHEVTLYAAGFHTDVPASARTVRVPALRGSAYATILSFPTAFRAVRRRHDLVHAQGWVAPAAEVVTTHIVLRAWREAARRAGVRSALGERWFGAAVERREEALVRGARRVIAPSRKVRDELRRCYGREHGVSVLYHAFPDVSPDLPDRLKVRTAFRLPEDAFVALYVGDPRKGLEASLTAIARTPDVFLAVASRSPPKAYLARAAELGIERQVRWLGRLHDATPAYAAADALLHPTIYDAFGLVVAEAMAYGVPPVVSGEAGITELIADGESGILVPPNDPELIAAALERLAGDPALRARLARGARAVAQARTWDHVALETLAVYEDAAS